MPQKRTCKPNPAQERRERQRKEEKGQKKIRKKISLGHKPKEIVLLVEIEKVQIKNGEKQGNAELIFPNLHSAHEVGGGIGSCLGTPFCTRYRYY